MGCVINTFSRSRKRGGCQPLIVTLVSDRLLTSKKQGPLDKGRARQEVSIVRFFYSIVCFTSYFAFDIALLPHSPGVVYYQLMLRLEARILGVAPFYFEIGIWDLFVIRGQKSYTPTAFGKLWTTPGVRCTKHASL